MAVEIGIARNSLDVLSDVYGVESSFHDVSSVIQVSGTLASAFTLVGTILSVTQVLLPDYNHRELNRRIDLVRGDIKELESEMPWLPTVYIDGMHRIGLGMQYCLEIGRANNTITKMAYQERLRNLCCGLICNTDLHVLLNGIIGDGILQGDIMDDLYKRTGGNRARISALGTRMLQLISGGMLVSLTYDTMRFGKEYAA